MDGSVKKYQHTKEIFADGYWLMLFDIDSSKRTFRRFDEEITIYDDREIPSELVKLCGVDIYAYSQVQ